MQMGVGIRQSIADVDTDSLLSQNWPPSPPVHWRSCSETDSATTEKFGRKKIGKNSTENFGIPNFRRFRKSLATSSAMCTLTPWQTTDASSTSQIQASSVQHVPLCSWSIPRCHQ